MVFNLYFAFKDYNVSYKLIFVMKSIIFLLVKRLSLTLVLRTALPSSLIIKYILLVGWCLAVLSTQFRPYCAFKIELYYINIKI